MHDQAPDTRALLPNEPRALLADTLLEIVELSNKVNEIDATIRLLTEDIEVIVRAVNELGTALTNARQGIIQETSLVAAEAFEKQLKKLHEIISEAQKRPKRRFWQTRK